MWPASSVRSTAASSASAASEQASPSPPARDPERFEIKYWVPEEITARIFEYARPYLVLDPWSAKHGVLSQCQTSLYLETPSLGCYRKHIDQAPDRYKLRVRVYGDPARGMAFFETKRKVKSVTVKTRAGVSMNLVRPLIEGSYDALPASLGAKERRHLENFLYLQTVTHARPFVLVRAHREPYCSKDPREDIRMTFDRQICFQPAPDASFDCRPDGWVPVDGEAQHGLRGTHTMLELKFPRVAPLWMGKLVEKLDMWRVGYSKYLAAAQCMLDQPLQDALALDAASGGR